MAAAAGLPLLGAAGGGFGPAAAGTGVASGRPSVVTATGALCGVAAASASNAWAVGAAGNKRLILRWNGRGWKQVRSPTPVNGSTLFG
jgi:hypothetical protein